MNYSVQGTDWFSKTISIDDAIDKICDQRRQRRDIQIPIKNARFGLNNDSTAISVTIEGVDYEPTMHCLKQMATWTGVSHAVLKQYTNPVLNQNGTIRYERDEHDMGLLLAMFKNGIREGRIDPDKEFRFRTYTDGTLRAMLSDRYAIIDNVWYLENIKKIFNEMGGDEPRFVHWRGNADTLYGNMLLPDTCRDESDSDYGGMISVSNCEIGKRRLALTPSVFRSICTNGMIFGQEMGRRLSQVHRGEIDLVKLRDRIVTNINEQIPLIKAGVDTFLTMKDKNLEVSADKMIAQVARDHKLSYGQKGEAAQAVIEFGKHESNFKNLFGIVNAITRVAQLQNPDEQVRLEEIGGYLMGFDDSRWVDYNKRAKTLHKDEYNKVFGLVS